MAVVLIGLILPTCGIRILSASNAASFPQCPPLPTSPNRDFAGTFRYPTGCQLQRDSATHLDKWHDPHLSRVIIERLPPSSFINLHCAASSHCERAQIAIFEPNASRETEKRNLVTFSLTNAPLFHFPHLSQKKHQSTKVIIHNQPNSSKHGFHGQIHGCTPGGPRCAHQLHATSAFIRSPRQHQLCPR